MLKKLTALLLVFNCAIACAQTIKTDVLVIGGSPSGVAAAIQAARSKVKTVLVDNEPIHPKARPGSKEYMTVSPMEIGTVKEDHNLPSGIWGEFRKRFLEYDPSKEKRYTGYNAPITLDTWSSKIILKQICDTVKNLTVDSVSVFSSIKKDGDRWDVIITQDGKTKTFKSRVIVDATDNGEIVKKAGGSISMINILENTGESTRYRTSIAMGDDILLRFDTLVSKTNYPDFPAYFVPVKAIIANGVDNMLAVGKLIAGSATTRLPMQLTLGQGAGVTAAYLAYFKTTTANLNVRAIQGELLDFKGYLLPLEDISADPYWRAIQQVCATGVLKGVTKGSGKTTEFLFMPDSTVNTAEIKPYLSEIYTRAFLWFNREKPGDKFTVGNLVSFMSELTLTDPENMRRSISKAWSTQYKFTSAFDMNRPITRREFAILANKYLNPFARTVDLDGKMVN